VRLARTVCLLTTVNKHHDAVQSSQPYRTPVPSISRVSFCVLVATKTKTLRSIIIFHGFYSIFDFHRKNAQRNSEILNLNLKDYNKPAEAIFLSFLGHFRTRVRGSTLALKKVIQHSAPRTVKQPREPETRTSPPTTELKTTISHTIYRKIQVTTFNDRPE